MTGLPARGDRFTDRTGADYVVVGRQWNNTRREMTVTFRPEPESHSAASTAARFLSGEPDGACPRCHGWRSVHLPLPAGGTEEVPCPTCGTHPSGRDTR